MAPTPTCTPNPAKPAKKISIRPMRTAADVAAAKRLFTAYAASLAIDLSYQSFDAELAALPGKYAPPDGDVLIAWMARGAVSATETSFGDGIVDADVDVGEEEEEAVGCVALRALPQSRPLSTSPSSSAPTKASPQSRAEEDSDDDGGDEGKKKLSEMKRLYVAPTARGTGLGRQLAAAILATARRCGYDGVRLDSLDSMAAAKGLYASLGFCEIAPYYETPVAGTTFWGLDLRS